MSKHRIKVVIDDEDVDLMIENTGHIKYDLARCKLCHADGYVNLQEYGYPAKTKGVPRDFLKHKPFCPLNRNLKDVILDKEMGI